MTVPAPSLDRLVTALIPSLSNSLAKHFNLFRVMHHGTHEKQISNVFAWLLHAGGTHGLGDAFQQIFVAQVNRALADCDQLPPTGYQVHQEVDTSGHSALGKDIADIVLASERASIVIENFESSDGHGHDFALYLAHGAAGGKQSVVVLLCAKFEPALQKNGWQKAVVITYASLLDALRSHIAGDAAWSRTHPQQRFFIGQMVEHFGGGTVSIGEEERIAFIKSMCDTGESARYGQRPQKLAAKQFADLLAQHATRSFEEGRNTLGQLKKALKRFAEQTLAEQVNAACAEADITGVEARFVGQWEWCITLARADSKPSVFLEFGPTAVVENARAPKPLVDPDYTKVFVTRYATGYEGIDHIIETDVGFEAVLAGIDANDTRLRDAVISAIRAQHRLQPLNPTDASMDNDDSELAEMRKRYEEKQKVLLAEKAAEKKKAAAKTAKK